MEDYRELAQGIRMIREAAEHHQAGR